MHKLTKVIELLVFPGPQELSEMDAKLLAIAKETLQEAYAPYSKFKVGCALLLENGVIVKGNNQENAAYPSGLCAERVAVFYAGATYPGVPIRAMAITAKAPHHVLDYPVMSCGACLQCIAEYEQKQGEGIRTILQGESGEVYISEIGSNAFLPFQFSGKEL